MTAQASELLVLDGQFEWMNSLPLQGYLQQRKLDLRAMSDGYTTGLYRGYQGVWEIAGECLYLIGLLDYRGQPFDPGIVFDGQSWPILADWFSGRLEIDQGEALTYFHMGWGHEHATRLRLYVRKGRVQARRRYDQARLLKRRFDRFVAEHADWLEILRAQAREGAEPLGGFTAAGLRAIGRPELEAEGTLESWSAGWTSEETHEIAGQMMQHCVRAPR